MVLKRANCRKDLLYTDIVTLPASSVDEQGGTEEQDWEGEAEFVLTVLGFRMHNRICRCIHILLVYICLIFPLVLLQEVPQQYQSVSINKFIVLIISSVAGCGGCRVNGIAFF